jgi:hypothetical protein
MFNFYVLVVVRVVALALGVLAITGLAIERLSVEQALGMLLVAFVLLCLADLQDTFALNRTMKMLEAKRGKHADESWDKGQNKNQDKSQGKYQDEGQNAFSHKDILSCENELPNSKDDQLHV